MPDNPKRQGRHVGQGGQPPAPFGASDLQRSRTASSSVHVPVVEVSEEGQTAAPGDSGDAELEELRRRAEEADALRKQVGELEGLRKQVGELEAARKKSEAQLKEALSGKRRLDQKVSQLEGRLRKSQESQSTLSTQLKERDARLRQATETQASLNRQIRDRDERLRAASQASSQQSATIATRDATIASMRERAASLEAAIASRDARLTQLQESYDKLEETHNTLVRELEEETDRYTRQKEETLGRQVRDALAQWSLSCQEYEPVPAGHDEALHVNQINDEIRDSLVASTNSFQRDLTAIRTAMESLDATRNALRKDLDLWQQRLFVGRYERLALCLQEFDAEIMRTRKARLAASVADEAEPADVTKGWDDLIDHLQILSDYLKSSCEGFGLRFFRPHENEDFDAVRHQVQGARPTGADGTRPLVDTCVAAGIEVQAADGETALVRPAIVTIRFA